MIVNAIRFLKPTAINLADFCVDGDGNIEYWNAAKLGIQPTSAEIQAAIPLASAAIAATAYKGKRAAEYPPLADYLDAVVKGDVAQQQAYIDACLAVKAKWPKP